jgi:hypothetical protein
MLACSPLAVKAPPERSPEHPADEPVRRIRCSEGVPKRAVNLPVDGVTCHLVGAIPRMFWRGEESEARRGWERLSGNLCGRRRRGSCEGVWDS